MSKSDKHIYLSPPHLGGDELRLLAEAVDAPRVSQTSASGKPTVEGGFDLDVMQALKAMGHELGDDRMRVIGSVQAVVVDEQRGLQYGAADRRRMGGIQSLSRSAVRRSSVDDDAAADGIGPRLAPLGINGVPPDR